MRARLVKEKNEAKRVKSVNGKHEKRSNHSYYLLKQNRDTRSIKIDIRLHHYDEQLLKAIASLVAGVLILLKSEVLDVAFVADGLHVVLEF